MINEKDVVRMRIPFPNIDSNLAVSTHMYICMENGIEKKFVKSQTKKPYHLMKNSEPFRRIVEDVNIQRNPFNRKTLIDCDKLFAVKDISIHSDLLTTSRRDVCEDLFSQISRALSHDNLNTHHLEKDLLLRLNYKMKSIAN